MPRKKLGYSQLYQQMKEQDSRAQSMARLVDNWPELSRNEQKEYELTDDEFDALNDCQRILYKVHDAAYAKAEKIMYELIKMK